MFLCGNFKSGKKHCIQCRRFLLWGISVGYCSKQKQDMGLTDHCKYFKRDYELWTKDGKCKGKSYEQYL